MKTNENGYYIGTIEEFVEHVRQELGSLSADEEEKLRTTFATELAQERIAYLRSASVVQ